jgi:fatty-acyl-CoA synthase
MRGQMMDYPLTTRQILDHAGALFAKKTVVTREADGSVTRSTYGDVFRRARRLASALSRLGVGDATRVATMCWNTQRHLEVYLAVPTMGAVLHTVNFRLFAGQIAYIMNHAEDEILIVDPSVIPVLGQIHEPIPRLRHVIVAGDVPDATATLLGTPVHAYEELLEAERDEFDFPHLDEGQAAAMCYTSGTTGEPKGVVYSHRAIMLHTMAEAMVDVLAVSERDVVMPVVPMFHVNSWGLPFTCALVGANQVLPGPAPTPSDLARLIESERVTMSAGVPTVWLGVLAAQQQEPRDFSSLTRIAVGGSAAPRALIEAYEERFGVPIWHAWGMTEMTPLGTVSRPKSYLANADPETLRRIQATQGLPTPFVDIRAIDEQGHDVPWDGASMGELVVRGPWVMAGYHGQDSSDRFTADGWFRTGDVVTIDEEGYLQLTDRTKDLVKSGGEWISSVDLENALMAHPAVAEAAVIAIPNERWAERPLACVVKRPGAEPTVAELIDFLRPDFARWWLPDDVVFIDEIPRTGVGKFDKKVLRERFRDHVATRA